ncbi:MAG: hypothetical protein IIU22_01545, partial [Firmicutes bacterium]|nr:hypothetical protein [Bacillota bacterium]
MDELMKRTHYCGTLRKEDIGKKAVVNGWVAKNRRLGALVFADIRDRSGIVQVVFDENTPDEVREKAETLRGEYCVGVSGTVRERESKNEDLPTGYIEIVADALRGHQLAGLALALDEQDDNLAPVAILGGRDVAPAQVLRLGRAHAGIAHDEHEFVAHLAIPRALRCGRLLDPTTPEGVQLAVFLKRELVATGRFQLGFALEAMAGGHVPLADGVVHDRVERAHLEGDGRV